MLTKPSIAEALSAATALLLSSLPLSDATKAAARSIPAYDDYPLARSAVFDERGNALHCKYSNDQFRKRNEYSAALDFYIAGSSVMTGTITCPKAGDEEAFQASYQRSPTLKMYNPDFIRGDAGFTFNDSPPPDGTGSDPLRQMDADLRKAFCSAAIETSKVKIGSFAELCTKDYPGEISSTFDDRKNALRCSYGHGKKRTELSASFDFYITGSTMKTESITCPRAGRRKAFRTAYYMHPALRMYNPDPASGRRSYVFRVSPPPRNTGLDPLRKLSIPDPRFHDKDELLTAAKERPSSCSVAIEVIKKEFGYTFPELCSAYREESREAIRAAKREGWDFTNNTLGSTDVMPRSPK
ncbi:hypothetical protein FOZ61_003821 [Perkinsus olseni]|uniref:Uncharacterized protein n=2 Tax=Perkinsus olseni TaxID=32597 RepID=A0A7J6LNF8_PEROL|nr:hypothetical protein FOZ61_003821 [Perkinsus olseni]